jgi:hypothetical protein
MPESIAKIQGIDQSNQAGVDHDGRERENSAEQKKKVQK